MEKPIKIAGGFVGTNEGEISNSYANTTIDTNVKVGGFCYKNSGTIEKCFSKNFVKHDRKIAGFCARNTGGALYKYFWFNRNINKVKTSNDETISIEDLKKKYEWDFENIWISKTDNLSDIRLRQQNNNEELNKVGNIVEISNAEELYEFATKVNKGYLKYRRANVTLKNDIDLKGKNWIPIGTNEENSFCGTFNGNGKTIKNFKIYQKKLNYVGFFGYIKEAIVKNLKLDCMCKGNKFVGTLAGVNDNGIIVNCSAVSKIHIGETTGGLIGKNMGKIDQCYYSGQILFAILLNHLFIKMMAVLLIIAIIVAISVKYIMKDIYVPVAVDPNIIIDDREEAEYAGSSKDNKASFDFSQTIQIQSSTMTGKFDFRNPKRGNHNIVLKLLISSKEVSEKLGMEDKQEETMIELYRSGLIKRGYKLPVIAISDLPDGTKLTAGEYKAIVSLEFYKVDTNEKAIVNTDLPVDLIIK